MLKTQLVYSQDINDTKGYLLASNEHLENILRQHDQIVIQGAKDDDFVFTTESETFKMQIVQTRCTMLILNPETGIIQQQSSDVLGIIKVLPDFSTLYKDLLTRAVSEETYKHQKLANIINQYGLTLQQLQQQYKISKKQLAEFLKFTDTIKFGDVWISLDTTLLTYFMRNLLLFLNQNHLISQWFTYQQIAQKIQMSSEYFLQAMAKKFHMATSEKGYKIEITSIIRFIVVEFSCIKTIFLKKQFDEMLRQALTIYLPVGIQVPDIIPEVYEYFFYIKAKNQMIYYDPLMSEGTVRSRLKFMQKYKKRFFIDEIKGAFYGLFEDVEIGNVMMQKFRKYGQQYEIKGITNK